MMSQKTLAAVVVAAASLWAQLAAAVSPTADEMAAARQWVAARFEGGQQAQTPEPFFSFNYGGKPATELLKTWKLKRANRRLDDQRVERTLTYADRATGLVVRCVGIEYLDYPNVEWTLFFKNAGNEDTPILSDIQALDLRVERKPQVGGDKGEFLLHHNTGSQTQPSDYQPHQTTLGPGAELVLAASGRAPHRASPLVLQSQTFAQPGHHHRRGLARPISHATEPRQRERRADSHGPGVDAFQAVARRRSAHAARRRSSFGRARIGSVPKTSGVAGSSPTIFASQAEDCRPPNGAARPRSGAA